MFTVFARHKEEKVQNSEHMQTLGEFWNNLARENSHVLGSDFKLETMAEGIEWNSYQTGFMPSNLQLLIHWR